MTPKLWLCAAGAAILLAAAPALAQDPPASDYGPWGFDLKAMDRAARPGDDFFRYANGAWLDRLVIPADRPAYGASDELAALTETRLHALLDQAAAKRADASPLEAKVGAFHRAFMDEARIEALGAKPLAGDLAAIRAARDRAALAALMGRQNETFHGTLFTVGIDIDAKASDRYAVQLGQGGLGLPGRDFYLEPNFTAERAAYQAHIEKLLALAGWAEPKARAADVMAFETAIARANWSETERRDSEKTYNPMTLAELEAVAPGFDWRGFFKAARLSPDRVVVSEKSAVAGIAQVFAAARIETLRAWAAFQLTDNAAFYLSRPFADARFEMRDKTLMGQGEPGPRWRRAIRAVGGGHYFSPDRIDRFGNMGWGVGELYTAAWFDPATKAKMQGLTAQLVAAFRARTERSDWMSPQTKREALRKLDAFKIKVGYPDKARDYSSLVVRDDDLYGDVERAAALEWRHRVGLLRGPVDRDEWRLTPQTIDAYASPLNDLVFPAAFLQAPHFDPKADPAVNYGSAVAVIGHELTHGFDDQGRNFDADGKLRDWWTPQDKQNFDARAAGLAAQIAAFEPLPGVKLDPALSMGETIADLGGLSLALEAYHRSLDGAPAPVIDGLTGDQRLYLAWAQVWRGKDSEAWVRMRAASNGHPPRAFRVNGMLRNLDGWYRAFDVKPGDALYLAPDKRVTLW